VKVTESIGRSGLQGECGPKLNPEKSADEWLSDSHAPWKKLSNEKPPGKTMAYDEIMKQMLSGELPL
jgi:glycerol transport system substrate-binding protein